MITFTEYKADGTREGTTRHRSNRTNESLERDYGLERLAFLRAKATFHWILLFVRLAKDFRQDRRTLLGWSDFVKSIAGFRRKFQIHKEYAYAKYKRASLFLHAKNILIFVNFPKKTLPLESSIYDPYAVFFFCFVAGISSSLSFLSILLLKFPILQHSGTGSCFVDEIPSCNVCLSSGTFARFWYSSLVNSVIFLFVSAISFFAANLTFHLINRSLYPITDLPLNYRFLISFSFYRCNSSKMSLSLKFLARSFAILFALSLQILFYVKSIAFLLSRLAMQSYL